MTLIFFLLEGKHGQTKQGKGKSFFFYNLMTTFETKFFLFYIGSFWGVI